MPLVEKPDNTGIEDVIDCILKGESSLYETIVRRYDKYLYKIGRSYGFDHQATEDLMQECFVNAYIHLKDFEKRSTFKTWLTRIMVHQCYHKKHQSKYKNETYEIDEVYEDTPPAFFSSQKEPDEFVSNNELKYNLEEALLHIPEDYRMVFTLRELNGMSIHDTAEALSISENNVKVRLNRAHTMLRHEIEKTYTSEEIFEFNLIYCDALVARVMSTIHALENPHIRDQLL
ncbi:MAG: sigma-70 family RNA polymerase sigma factor [Bacteroidetes bacterium]|nr:sigma-70 family RNA polymerase sigma factor [Bacteroidota bacterium]